MKKKWYYLAYHKKRSVIKQLMIMKITLLLLTVTALQLSASVYSQENMFNLKIERTTIKEALAEIENASQYKFLYRNELIDVNKLVDLKVKDANIQLVLEELFEEENIVYRIFDDNLIVLTKNKDALQELTVSGKITDIDGNSLPGVNIVEKGTTNGAVSDLDGNYTITVSSPNSILSFSYVGYLTEEVEVGSRTTIDMELVQDIMALDEVVVTALGMKREKKALGFAAQEIGENDLSASREASISSYLTGKVAGVQVSKTAGGAGSSTNVVIRGNSSLSGDNQPLYVVDGVPIINFSNNHSASSIASADLDYGDGIGELNPQDVQSMNVLKGPAATALYGSRGANGVVIITTKSGRKEKGIGVEINSGITFEKLNLLPKYQNEFSSGYDDELYANYSWGGFTFDGIYYPWPENGLLDSWGGPLDGSQKIPNWWTLPEDGSIPSSVWDCPITEAIPNVAQPEDNVRDFFETGVTYSNNVAVTSANEKSSMRLSVGSITTKGIVPNHEIKRKSVSFRAATEVNKILSFDGKVNYIRSEGNQRPTTGYSRSNPFSTLITMPRNTPLDFIKYQYETTKVNIRYPGIDYNPYYIVNEIKNDDFKDRVVGFTSATLKFTDWLSLMGRVGVDFYSEIRTQTWPYDPNSRNSDSRLGQMIEATRRAQEINADLILSLNKKISESVSLNGVIGTSLRSFRRDVHSWDAREFKSGGVYHISNFNDIRADSDLSEKEIQSVFFTGQVGYRNFLFLDVTGRNDWSSALGVDEQSFFYPSVSTSFIFTEAINIHQGILSFGKVRASWAQVGNDSDPYLTRSGYSLYATGFDGLPYASKSGTIPLWNLKNELTESYEFGADLRFFNNKVNLDVTYYNGKTTNQILRLDVSDASGYANEVINAGEIKNSGIEATLGLTPVNSGNFSWDINFNYAANQSEVVVLDGTIQTYRLIENASHNSFSDIYAEVGASYGNIIGYAYKRAPDGQKIVDASGKYLPEDEVSVLGNITPDWIGGLNNTFSYKGIRLNVLLDFVQGGDIVSATKYEMTRKGTGAWTVEGRRPQARDAEGNVLPYTGVLDGVVEITDGEGNVTGYEKNTTAVPGQNYWGSRAWDGISEEFIEDGSYISLREVMLSYSVQPSLLKNIPITGLTISLIGRNLAYLQNKMDYLGLSPESAPNTAGGASGIEALAVPSTRTYGFNIKLSF